MLKSSAREKPRLNRKGNIMNSFDRIAAGHDLILTWSEGSPVADEDGNFTVNGPLEFTLSLEDDTTGEELDTESIIITSPAEFEDSTKWAAAEQKLRQRNPGTNNLGLTNA
jgi:hypothetical protein